MGVRGAGKVGGVVVRQATLANVTLALVSGFYGNGGSEMDELISLPSNPLARVFPTGGKQPPKLIWV